MSERKSEIICPKVEFFNKKWTSQLYYAFILRKGIVKKAEGLWILSLSTFLIGVGVILPQLPHMLPNDCKVQCLKDP